MERWSAGNFDETRRFTKANLCPSTNTKHKGLTRFPCNRPHTSYSERIPTVEIIRRNRRQFLEIHLRRPLLRYTQTPATRSAEFLLQFFPLLRKDPSELGRETLRKGKFLCVDSASESRRPSAVFSHSGQMPFENGHSHWRSLLQRGFTLWWGSCPSRDCWQCRWCFWCPYAREVHTYTSMDNYNAIYLMLELPESIFVWR